MNQNRNNNRRRGRGNNNRGGGGGGQMQGNRIDSRARGNAPQMLDKYKKLAHEASLNDDRVQTEYFLQFADHYFRVIADGKAQKDDRQPRNEDRGYDRGDDRNEDRSFDRDEEYGDGGEDGGNAAGGDAGGDTRPDRGNRQRGNDTRGNDTRGNEARVRRGRNQAQPLAGAEGESGDQQDDDNPFTRDTRSGDSRPADDVRAKAKKPRRRKDADEDTSAQSGGGLDPAMLPPAITRSAEDAEDAAPRKPRKLAPRRKPRGEDDDGALEAVG